VSELDSESEKNCSACGPSGCPLCRPRFLVALVVVFVVVQALMWFGGGAVGPRTRGIEWPQFLEELKRGDMERVIADSRRYRGRYLPGCEYERFYTEGPAIYLEPGLPELIRKHSMLVVER